MFSFVFIMNTLHILVFLYYPIFYFNPSTKPSAILIEVTISVKNLFIIHPRQIVLGHNYRGMNHQLTYKFG